MQAGYDRYIERKAEFVVERLGIALMNNHKKNVRIRIESTANGSSKTVQKTTGILYERSGSIYLRYVEPDESMGKTTTVLRIRPEAAEFISNAAGAQPGSVETMLGLETNRKIDFRVQELALNRFGDAKMNQRFIPGKEQTVVYSMQHGQLEWKVFTYKAKAELLRGQAAIEWEYDSWFAHEYTGKMRIRIIVQPAE